MNADASAVICTTRVPVPGRVKTRLMGTLTPEECARVQTALLQDEADVLRECAVDSFVFHTGGDPEPLRKIFPEAAFYPQPEGDLGYRMHRAFETVSALGHRKMVLVGSDLPFLSAAQIRAGLSILDRCNCAVGPSEDGGYYLLGLRTPCADLFQGQAYGHGNVLENLLLRLRTLGMTWDLCPAAGDLDTRDDLLALLPRKEELRSNLRRFLESLEVEGPCRI